MTLRYQQRLTALMIDDDIDFINIIRRRLRTLDIDLISTNSKKDFMDHLEKVNPHFCMIDLNINSAEEGFSIIEEVRASSKDELILFIVSSEFGVEAVTHALEIGATDYFTKPIDKEIFEKKLSYYLDVLISANSTKSYRPLENGPQSIQIDLSVHLDGIDEFGVKFKSPHLLPKGSLVKISGEIIKNITGEEKILTSVLSNGLDPESKLYFYYAEFNDASEDCMNKIRNWLHNKLGSMTSSDLK